MLRNPRARNGAGVQPRSIGFAWPPRYDPSNRRITGFYPCLIDTKDAFLDMRIGASIIPPHTDGPVYLAAKEWAKHHDATRLTLRCLMNNDLVELTKRQCCDFGKYMRGYYSEFVGRKTYENDEGQLTNVIHSEAYIDLSRVIPGFSIVYLGCNEKEREIGLDIVRTEQRNIIRINEMPTISSDAAIELVNAAGFYIGQLENASKEEIKSITQLYQQAFQRYPFPINEQTIGEIVCNSAIALVIRNRKGHIVAALVAEHAELPIENRMVNLIEISEAATDVYQGTGVLTALYHRMNTLLREGYNLNNTIVYAEARAPWLPINIAIRQAGFEYCGMLSQHCTIVGNRSPGMQYDGDFEDRTVWVYPSF